ncbi:MAG: hypothetical protein COA52_05960 [Hyphomicrobiales bacterium]|nr:MAG: hypothetical protein COA52_05960 [Hyphomicrobiales bacterium]
MKHTSKVTATKLPAHSLLHDRVAPQDFLDCYCVASDLSPRQAADIITDFPGWARLLLVVRRMFTAPFGLSNDGPVAEDKVGIFPVETETGTETSGELIAGFNDRHLDFRVSVISENGRVFLGTWVHPHNFGGRLYLAIILPFHILISRNALARVSAEPASTASKLG